MDSRPYKNPENKQGGPLKTTTWGALIAFSLLIAGLGLTSYVFLPHGNPQAIETAANISRNQTPVLGSAASGGYGAGSSGHGLNGGSTFHPYNVLSGTGAIAAQSSASANGYAVLPSNTPAAPSNQAAPQQDPANGGASSGGLNLQAQIAAKIAPDL